MGRLPAITAAADENAAIEDVASRWVARRDAGLSDAEEAEFQRWLGADVRHARAVEDYGSAWSALARPLRTGAGHELLQELNRRRRRSLRRKIGVAAAGLLIIAALGIYWQRPRPMEAKAAAPVMANAVMLMPASRVLPDGSIVELKDGAEITVDYSDAARRIVLGKGEAHFIVKENAARPFVVAAGDRVQVRAVGTAFSVHYGTSQVAVLVTEGRVAVEQRGATDAGVPGAAKNSVGDASSLGMLDAGRRMVVELGRRDSGAPVVDTVPAAEMNERLAWRTPRVEFNGTPLADCVALLNRHGMGRQLQIDDPTLRSVRVSGVFRADNTDSFVMIMEEGFGLKATVEGNIIRLQRAAP